MTDTIVYEDHQHGVDVALEDLDVDLDVQRVIMPERLRKIASNFNPILVGELLVSKRRDGKLVVLDGHHRLESAKMLNGQAPSTFKAEVFTGLSKADEARLFLGRNDRANVRGYDRFRNMATLGDQDTLDVHMAAQAAGFVFISKDIADATFRDRAAGVTIMHDAERRKGVEVSGVDHLTRVMSLYARTYGTEDSVESLILKAVSKIFLRFEHVDEDRLSVQLRSVPPQVITVQAEDHYNEERALRRFSKVSAAIEIIAELYNRNLPANSATRIRL